MRVSSVGLASRRVSCRGVLDDVMKERAHDGEIGIRELRRRQRGNDLRGDRMAST
jgi:hypothetical protein